MFMVPVYLLKSKLSKLNTSRKANNSDIKILHVSESEIRFRLLSKEVKGFSPTRKIVEFFDYRWTLKWFSKGIFSKYSVFAVVKIEFWTQCTEIFFFMLASLAELSNHDKPPQIWNGLVLRTPMALVHVHFWN